MTGMIYASQQPAFRAGGGGGASAPVPFSKFSAKLGDSRSTSSTGSYNVHTFGSSPTGQLKNSASTGEIMTWVENLTKGKLTWLTSHLEGEFGIGSEDTYAIATIPRANALKGLDYVARSPAAIVQILAGTNDNPTKLGGADPGKGNGALNSLNTRSNVRYMIEYLTDPVFNAATNLALGIDGGVCNLYGGQAKVIILPNEVPRGRYVNTSNVTSLALPHGDQAAFFAYSRWLMTLDYAYQSTTGYANVIVPDTYGAVIDWTTVPDATVGRPVGAPAFGGGSTANADTFLPVIGAWYDGLHPTTHGAFLVATAIKNRLATVWPSMADHSALFPGPSTASDFVTPSSRLPSGGTAGTVVGTFNSVTGASNLPTLTRVTATAMSEIDLTITAYTDTDGERVLRFQGSGTSTSAGEKIIGLGFLLTAAQWNVGTYGPTVSANDKLRMLSQVRINAANKLNGVGITNTISATTSLYDSNSGGPQPGSSANRIYLQDDLKGISIGTDWFPVMGRPHDTHAMATTPTQPPFGNLDAKLNFSFHSTTTDAPIGTAVNFDFEVKGLGWREVDDGITMNMTTLDWFTATDGTSLTGRSAPSGTWSLATGYTDEAQVTSNRACSQGTGFTVYSNSTVPATTSYQVWSRLRRVTGAGVGGVAARIQSGAATFYAAVYDAAGGNIVVSRYNAGTQTVLQTTAVTIADSTDFTLALDVHDINDNITELRCYRNGAFVGEAIRDTSGSRITVKGTAGAIFSGGSSTTGVHMDTIAICTL